MKITMKDIAVQSGVALGTVSNYFNGNKIKKENEEKIEKVIKDLNYKPNNIGKYLAQGCTKTVGIITNNLNSSFFTKVIISLDGYLTSIGYNTIICNSNNNLKIEKQKLDFMSGQLVDAVILFPIGYTSTKIPSFFNNKNLILADKLIKNSYFNAVILDNKKSCYEATIRFIKNGHKNIAFLGGDPDSYTMLERLAGYKKALKDHNIPVNEEIIFKGEYTEEAGYAMANCTLDLKFGVTAFILTNHHILPGVLHAIDKRKLNIPEDFSYIVFEEHEFSNLIRPTPSSVIQPSKEMGMALGELIIKTINSETTDDKTVIKLETKLHITDSIGTVKE